MSRTSTALSQPPKEDVEEVIKSDEVGYVTGQSIQLNGGVRTS